MGQLPSEFGHRQLEVRLCNHGVQQIVPAPHQQFETEPSPIHSGGRMHHEGRRMLSCRMVKSHVVSNAMLLS